jgi:hypothetical protein
MATHKEYEEWKADPAAQQEYTQYLLKEAQKTAPDLDQFIDQFIDQFTRQFDKIFKEKS